MAQRTVIEVGPRGGQRVGRYMGKDGKIHWIYLGKGGAGVGAGLEHGHPAPDDAPAEEHRAQPAHETHGHVHKDPRIPPVGTQRTATYKGQQHTMTVTPEGYRYEGNGQQYRSLSQLATELADSRQNGFRFFGLHEDAGVDRRRKEAGAAGEADPKAKRTVALSPAGQQAAQAAQAAAQAPAGPQPRTVALAPGASSTAPAGAAPQAAPAGGRAEAPEAERRPPEASQPPAEQPGGVDEGKAEPTSAHPTLRRWFAEHGVPRGDAPFDTRLGQMIQASERQDFPQPLVAAVLGLEYAIATGRLSGEAEQVVKKLSPTDLLSILDEFAATGKPMGEAPRWIEAMLGPRQEAPPTATATAAPQAPEKPPEAPPAAPETATATAPPAAPAAPQGGLPPRPTAGPQQGDLLPRERGQLTLTSPEAPQARRPQGAEQPSLFGAPERPAAEPGKPPEGPRVLGPYAADSADLADKYGLPFTEPVLRAIGESLDAGESTEEAVAAGGQAAGGGPAKPSDESGASAPSSQEPAPKPAPEAPAPAPEAAETQSQTSQAPTVQEPPPAEAPKPAAPAPEAASPTAQGPRSEAALPPRALEHPPEARGANQPRTTGNEEQRQGNLAAPDIAGMEAALKPHRARVDAAKTPGERLQALTAEYTARSEHGRQLAGMEGPEARQAVERNREAMGRLNSAIGSLRAAGAGEKPSPAAAPEESQAEMKESRGRLSAPGPEGKPRTVVTRQGVQQALDGAKRRTDLTASAHKAATEALAKGDFTAAREALAKGSTDRYRRTALEYVDRLEDAAREKPPTRQEGQAPREAAGAAGAPAAAAKAPPSPQDAAAAAKPGEYHRAIADHAAAHLTAAEERARPHVERILEKVGGAAALGEKIPSNPEHRQRAFKRWAEDVYEKIGRDLEAAGLEPHAAQGVVEHTVSRSNWHPDAKAALLAHISGERGKALAPKARLVGDAAENLAGAELGHEVAAGHVQQAAEATLSDPTRVLQRAEVAVARLQSELTAAEKGDPDAMRRALAVALGPEIHDARALKTAFPGIEDRVIGPMNAALARVHALGRTEPTTQGAQADLYFKGANGKKTSAPVRYRLVEADQLVPSHDPNNRFQPNPAYPAGAQERQYHTDKSHQNTVRDNARDLTPGLLVTDDPTAVNGPPVVTPEGIVLGGNSRTMSLGLAYQDHPEKADAYRKMLSDKAHLFGLQPQDVGALKNPVLVREVDVPDRSPKNLARLSHQLNESFTMGMDPRALAAGMASRIDDATVRKLAENLDPDESLNDYLARGGARAREFTDRLEKDGVIDSRNRSAYMEGGKLHGAGRRMVTEFLLGKMIGDVNVSSGMRDSLYSSVSRAMPYIYSAEGHGEGFNIRPSLRNAIDAFNKLDEAKERGTLERLPGADAESWEHRAALNKALAGDAFRADHPVLKDDRGMALLELLMRHGGPNQLGGVFREYAKLAGQHSLVQGRLAEHSGDEPKLSPAEVFDKAIRSVVEAKRRETDEAGEARRQNKGKGSKTEEGEPASPPGEAPAEAGPAATPEPAPAAASPLPDPQQAAEEARAAREEAARKAEEDQAKRDREEAMRNQTSFL